MQRQPCEQKVKNNCTQHYFQNDAVSAGKHACDPKGIQDVEGQLFHRIAVGNRQAGGIGILGNQGEPAGNDVQANRTENLFQGVG